MKVDSDVKTVKEDMTTRLKDDRSKDPDFFPDTFGRVLTYLF